MDIFALILLILAFVRGWRKGIVVAVCSLLGFILGMMAALKLSTALGNWMLEQGWTSSAWAQIVAYLILFFGVLWCVRWIAKTIEKAMDTVMLGAVNRTAGGLLYAFIAAFIWSCMLWIANRAHLLSPEMLAGSKTYDWLEPIAPWVFAHIGAVLPFARDIFQDLGQYFDRVNETLPGHVGPAR